MTPLLAQRPRTDRGFERIYRRHVHEVYRYALAVLRNPSDAEDVTQTTFLNAYRAFQRGERPRATQNWLIAIAHNVCRQRFRQAARRPQEVEFAEEIAEAPLEGEGPSASDIRRALGQLAFNQRSALVMRELEGRSYGEIAGALDLSVSAVETLIFRARRALREQLEEGLTCHEAEFAISKQLDGELRRPERGALRAHLRQCGECATLARSQRAQRAAWKSLGATPLPSSLSSFFGGGGTGVAVGTGALGKAAALFVAGAVVSGAAYKVDSGDVWSTRSPEASAPQPRVLAGFGANPFYGAFASSGGSSSAAGIVSKGSLAGPLPGPPGAPIWPHPAEVGRGASQPATVAGTGAAPSLAAGSEPASGAGLSVAAQGDAVGQTVQAAGNEVSSAGGSATAAVGDAAGSATGAAQQVGQAVEPTLGRVEQPANQTVQHVVHGVPPVSVPSVFAPTLPSVPNLPSAPTVPTVTAPAVPTAAVPTVPGLPTVPPPPQLPGVPK